MNSLNNYNNIHFVGIGGIGMSAIALILKKLGKTVTGSDLGINKNIEKLNEVGVVTYKGHQVENIPTNTDCLVITSAVRSTNPEVAYANEKGLKILKRAEMLSLITNSRNTVAVAGSHGKTTTSCYLSELLINLDLNPTYIVGGVLKASSSNADLGSDLTVIEADESDSSFHFFKSKYALITNIDNDHVDFYGDFESLKEAFEKFITDNVKTPILNYDDKILRDLAQGKNHISFGSSSDVDYFFDIKKMKFGETEFSLEFKGEEHVLKTNITGDYNISNLVGAIAFAVENNISIDSIKNAVINFKGIKRRYDILSKNENRVIIDDYAHHPTEIEKLINAVKMDYPGFEIKVFFEPHRYTRTKNFWNEFTTCFVSADELNLFPIYAASEDEIQGITSKLLFKDIINKNKNYIDSLNEIEKILFKNEDKEVIVSLGAGPISSVFRDILNVENI